MSWEKMFRIIGDEPVAILIILGFIAMVFVGVPLYFIDLGLFFLVEVVGLICLMIGIALAIYDRS